MRKLIIKHAMLHLYLRRRLLSIAALILGFAGAIPAAPPDLQLGAAQALPRNLYGFNCDLLAATAFHGLTMGGPEMEVALRELRPAALRFPGGTPANNYRWQSDSFSAPTNDLTGWAGEQINHFRRIGRPYDLPGFARVCRQFGLTPVWVLNVYEETPASVAALMQHLAQLGLDVHDVEMGNEPYWDRRSLNDVRKYSELCRPLAAALRQAKPGVKIGACFAPLLEQPFNYVAKWNAVLARETWYDALVFHEYYGGQGMALEAGDKLPAWALLHPEAFIDEPVAALTKLVPGKPIWFTEWNLGTEGIKQWKNQGAELLFLGAIFTRLVQQRDAIDLAMFHQIYEVGFGTFYFDPATGEIKTTAAYEFFKLLGAAFAHADQLLPATFRNENLLGFATRGVDGVRLLAINRGAEAITLQLPDAFAGNLQQLTIDCPPEKTLPLSTALAHSRDLHDRTVTLPADSISLIAAPTALKPPPTSDAAKNLFPVRPFLTLWYPPYASPQPRVDATGSYTVSFANLTNKPMAVVKLDLKGLGLETGKTYALSFEARAEPDDGLSVNIPEGASKNSAPDSVQKPRSEWTPLAEKFRRLRYTFHYDPALNDGEVSFFFGPVTVARGGQFVFRDFHFVGVD